jgi:gliding motility-associated-like protein
MQPVIEVNDLSSGTYQWDFELDGLHFDTTYFSYTFDEAGWHTITLIATSGLGCSDTTSLPVFVGGHFFYAPNAFSPDGDGVNEVWRPSVRGARIYRLELFDRWGQVRFSTTDPAEGWDGAGLPAGIYAYKAWLSEWGPLEYEYNGSVMLVR